MRKRATSDGPNWALDEVRATLGRDEMLRDTNRRLSRMLTDETRKLVRTNDLTVRLPWPETDSPRTDGKWEEAEIVACLDSPRAVGTIMFRFTDEVMELKKPIITDRKSLVIDPRRRRT